MEKITLSLNTPISTSQNLNVTNMIERDGELLVTLGNRDCYEIFEGDKLTFRRCIEEDGIKNSVEINEEVTVLSEDADHVIHTTIPRMGRIYLNRAYGSFETENIDGIEYVFLRSDDNHNIFAQDLEIPVQQEIYLYDDFGNLVDTISGISIPIMSSFGRYLSGGTIQTDEYGERYVSGGQFRTVGNNHIVNSGDCITLVREDDTCGKDFDKIKIYSYEFLPQFFSRNMLAVTGLDPSKFDIIAYFETKFNPFYYYTEEIDEDTNPYRQCYFYGDVWWENIENGEHPEDELYINCGTTFSALSRPDFFWKIGTGLMNDINTDLLGSEDLYDRFTDSQIQENLIPPFIDMERVKYVPVVFTGDNYTIATGITFDFHFRKREFATPDNISENTTLTQDNVYVDGWNIKEDEWNTAWWNGMDYSGTTFNRSKFDNFLNTSGSTSDLLGYLNFTDSDVFYQKMKVSQTFVRLLFYTSPHITDQKLLFYSTIFLDGGELYGKYLKQLQFIDGKDDESLFDYNEELNKENVRVVFCNSFAVSGRVDSELNVTNEYDRTRSSEGFNLYLFADDAEITDSAESEDRTIYMKVEFNHAGNGKTIPMISNWPVDDRGRHVGLTTDNFIDSLYLPVKIRQIDGRYVYYMPSAVNDGENIRLIFFEPKLDTNGNS